MTKRQNIARLFLISSYNPGEFIYILKDKNKRE